MPALQVDKPRCGEAEEPTQDYRIINGQGRGSTQAARHQNPCPMPPCQSVRPSLATHPGMGFRVSNVRLASSGLHYGSIKRACPNPYNDKNFDSSFIIHWFTERVSAVKNIHVYTDDKVSLSAALIPGNPKTQGLAYLRP